MVLFVDIISTIVVTDLDILCENSAGQAHGLALAQKPKIKTIRVMKIELVFIFVVADPLFTISLQESASKIKLVNVPELVISSEEQDFLMRRELKAIILRRQLISCY